MMNIKTEEMLGLRIQLMSSRLTMLLKKKVRLHFTPDRCSASAMLKEKINIRKMRCIK